MFNNSSTAGDNLCDHLRQCSTVRYLNLTAYVGTFPMYIYIYIYIYVYIKYMYIYIYICIYIEREIDRYR